MSQEEQDKINAAIKDGTAKKMMYQGSHEVHTRGGNGEVVQSGWLLDNTIYVWDSTYGWIGMQSYPTTSFAPVSEKEELEFAIGRLKYLKEVFDPRDPEEAYSEAVDTLLSTLRKLGYKELADRFEEFKSG